MTQELVTRDDLKHRKALFTDAVAARRVVRVEYADADGEITQRSISPRSFRGTLRDGNLAVYALCHTAQAMRSFRLDRVLAVELIGGPLAPNAAEVRADGLVPVGRMVLPATAKPITGRVLLVDPPEGERFKPAPRSTPEPQSQPRPRWETLHLPEQTAPYVMRVPDEVEPAAFVRITDTPDTAPTKSSSAGVLLTLGLIALGVLVLVAIAGQH